MKTYQDLKQKHNALKAENEKQAAEIAALKAEIFKLHLSRCKCAICEEMRNVEA